MANLWYPEAREALLKGDIDLDTATLKVALIDTAAYTYSAAHDFLDDVAGGAIKGTSGALTSVTVANGLLDAADMAPAFSGVPAGDPCEALIIYIDTGSGATSRLLLYIDTGTGLPITPNGADINITWNASGIAQL